MIDLKLLMFSGFTLLLLSCQKNDQKTITEEKERIVTKEIYQVQSTQINISELLPTESNMEVIFPGNILAIDTTSNKAKVSVGINYTKMPVVWSASTNIGMYNNIPTFKNLQEYAKSLNDNNFQITSIGLNYWHQIYDHRVIYNIDGYHDDMNEFFKLFPIKDVPTKIEANKTVILSRGEYMINTVDMNLPKLNQLISKQEQDALNKSNLELYYINSVSYGNIYGFVLEGKAAADILRPIIFNALHAKSLSEADLKHLDQCTLSVYIRSGDSRSPFIKQSKGSAAILELVKESKEKLQFGKGIHTYPIKYRLRSLKDFASFNYRFHNRAYFKLD